VRNKSIFSGIFLVVLLINSCKKDELPTLSTQDVTEVTYTTANSGGIVTDDGGSSIVARGLCLNTTGSPTMTDILVKSGSGSGPFKKSITKLTPGTKYYIRAFAQSDAGIGYGNELSFETVAIQVPLLTTYPVIFETQTTINTGGEVLAEYGGFVSERGICWSTTANPTVELSTKTKASLVNGNFYSKITGLTAGTTYYLRAYATNEAGTGYGNEFNFTIHVDGTPVTDVDENIYNTVRIGTQVWMTENLKVTRFNDKTPISLVTSGYWQTVYPAYCWYNNDEAAYKPDYGALYNVYAAIQYYDKNICPTGWHVPDDGEWTTLITYLGGDSVAGGKLKESGTAHWLSPNPDATNESGFTALPGGTTNFNLGFSFVGLSGYWWSSGIGAFNMGTSHIIRAIFSHYNYVLRTNADNNYGYSIRCIRDY
jgi:uncharacterized protein (TIGR02145 family)